MKQLVSGVGFLVLAAFIREIRGEHAVAQVDLQGAAALGAVLAAWRLL